MLTVTGYVSMRTKGFINCNMKVKYRLSTDYDQKKEISLKTYNGGILINKG